MVIAHPTTASPINARWKIAAAVAAVLCLSAPSAVGVYRALEPTRGTVASGLAAAGFELAYLSLSLLVLRPELRQQARLVALGAVITAIALNGLADYGHRVVGGLASWPNAVKLFDPLALVLSVVESAPLAGLAFALASLLHRLAEEPPAEAPQVEPVEEAEGRDTPPPAPAALVWAREIEQPHYPAPELVDMGHTEAAPDEATTMLLENAFIALQTATDASTPKAYACPSCGASLASAGAYGAARRWGRCKQCP
jgi:hypothetical protein